MRYLKRLRLNAATALLRSSELSVKEIAHSVGFGDISHFVRDFRRAYGRSPSSFRLLAGVPAGGSSPAKRDVSVLANE